MGDPASFEYWRLAELLGVWAAAFATYYAATTAIKIATDERKIRIVPNIETGYFFPQGTKSIPAIALSVRNEGFRDATVTMFFFQHRLSSTRFFIIGYDFDYGKALPSRLASAEEHSFFVAKGTPHNEWVRDIADSLFKNSWRLPRWIIFYSLKITVQIGSGETFSARPGRQFLLLLRKNIRTSGST